MRVRRVGGIIHVVLCTRSRFILKPFCRKKTVIHSQLGRITLRYCIVQRRTDFAGDLSLDNEEIDLRYLRKKKCHCEKYVSKLKLNDMLLIF